MQRKGCSMNEQRRRNRRKPDNEEGAPAWMITYSDMITLVLAFFVLLFSFAVIDEARFEEVVSSIQLTFLGSEGILTGSVDPAELQDGFFEDDRIKEMQEIVEQVEAFVAEKGLEGTIDVIIDERGIVLEVSEALFFASASANLKEDAQEILNYIGELLRTIEHDVIVEGHTDNVPINTLQFPSNWELSVARAVVVVRYLVEIKQLPPTRFAAMGFGEFYPVDTNLTVEGRAKNRRVNIIIAIPNFGKEGVVQ